MELQIHIQDVKQRKIRFTIQDLTQSGDDNIGWIGTLHIDCNEFNVNWLGIATDDDNVGTCIGITGDISVLNDINKLIGGKGVFCY